MIMTSTHLNGHHRKTLARIFAHPTGHNLEWHDVLSLLEHVGSVEDRHGGGYEVTIADEHLKLSAAHDHDMAADEVRDLRRFLAKAGLTTAGLADGEVASADHDAALTTSAEHGAPAGCTILIDHHEARLFGLGSPSDRPDPRVLKPEDADGSIRRIEHRQGQDDHDGGHGPEDDAWYERIAACLEPTQRIVVLSDGKGRSNAGSYLIAYLKRHHPGICARIISVLRVDIAHLSDAQIAAMGRDLLAA
jgi:hypothetical protein